MTTPSTKRALLIGINYIGSSCELAGCINDIKNMEKFLLARGYVCETMSDDVAKSSSRYPTRANMLREMAAFVRDACPGDSLFFHYSGHGTSTRDTSGDERDGRDEMICPVDFDTAGGIVDDDLFRILCAKLPAGAALNCLFDCCHSGTILDLPNLYKFGTTSYAKVERSIESKNTTTGTVVAISGCRDDQTSADTVFDNRASGAMTFAFLQAHRYVAALGKTLDVVRLVKHMRAFLVSNNYDQVPQLTTSSGTVDVMIL